MGLYPVFVQSILSIWNIFTIGPLSPILSVTSSPRASQQLLAPAHVTASFEPPPSVAYSAQWCASIVPFNPREN